MAIDWRFYSITFHIQRTSTWAACCSYGFLAACIKISHLFALPYSWRPGHFSKQRPRKAERSNQRWGTLCQKRPLEVGGPLRCKKTDETETDGFFGTNLVRRMVGLAGMRVCLLRRSMSISNFQNINFENKRCSMMFGIDSNLRALETKGHERFLKNTREAQLASLPGMFGKVP